MAKNIKLEFVYEDPSSKPGDGEARIIQVKDLNEKISIDIIWNAANVDTAFCNYIIKMACSTRGICNK